MGKGLICSQLQSSAKYECINKIQPCLCVCERERREGGAGAPGSLARMMRRKKEQLSGGSEPSITL